MQISSGSKVDMPAWLCRPTWGQLARLVERVGWGLVLLSLGLALGLGSAVRAWSPQLAVEVATRRLCAGAEDRTTADPRRLWSIAQRLNAELPGQGHAWGLDPWGFPWRPLPLRPGDVQGCQTTWGSSGPNGLPEHGLGDDVYAFFVRDRAGQLQWSPSAEAAWLACLPELLLAGAGCLACLLLCAVGIRAALAPVAS